MSHWFSVKTKLNSVDAIKKAASQMGYMVVHNRKCRGYAGQETDCDLVLRLPGEYDIGFEKQEDGSYEIVADFWANHISDYLANADALKEAEKLFNEKIQSQEWSYSEGEAFLNEVKISKFMQAYNCAALEELVQMQGLQYIANTLPDGSVVYETYGNTNPEEKVITTVNPAGDLKVEAEGFTGTSCTDATTFLQNLGIVEHSENKPEFYAEEELLKEAIDER